MAENDQQKSQGKQKTLLVLSQVYVPDPASVGQHMADACAEMVRRGHRVKVLAAARGYDDPSKEYAKREVRDGVEIRRLPLSSFGKSSIAMRLIAGWIFIAQCMAHGLLTRKLGAILVSTSPPMCPVGAIIIGKIRRAPVKFWAMDLNPDQMIALGKISEKSVSARIFEFFNRITLRNSNDIVALDRFMADRLNAKVEVSRKMAVMPPWPHAEAESPIPHEENPFRKAHDLDGKFVVMYSGNHGPSNPITTVLQAALRMQDEKSIVFMFVGGGMGKKEVEDALSEHNPPNIRSLPYQPFSELRYSLSAADVHLVTVGDAIVGINHPCKVYGAMAVGRPILLVGPRPSHVSDLIDEDHIGWHVEHGDIEGAIKTIREIAATEREEIAKMGGRAKGIIDARLSKTELCGRFCDVLERGW